MKEKNTWQGGYWPTEQQTLILKASLTSGQTCLAAWDSLKRTLDISSLDIGALRLLPLLYKNLLQQKITATPLFKELQHYYHLTWLQNTQQLKVLEAVLALFEQHHIPTMILKGAPLMLQYYQDSGTRPMSDADLLIPCNRLPQALQLLTQTGWRPMEEISCAIIEKQTRVLKSCGFKNDAGAEMDIHWHVLMECMFMARECEFWDKSMPLQVGNAATRALNPTEQLLHVCAHGTLQNPLAPIRWIADAVHILSAPNTVINWEAFARYARKYHLSLRLNSALKYLKLIFDMDIPESVRQSLQQRPVFGFEQVEYTLANKSATALKPLHGGLRHYLKYARYTRGNLKGNIFQTLRWLAEHFKMVYQVESTWQLFFLIFYKMSRQLFRQLTAAPKGKS